jgi:hypothetical protein
MTRRLLVPVLFALAAGAWAALLWPAPQAHPAFALRVRLNVTTGHDQGRANTGGYAAGEALDDIKRGPDKLNATLADPNFLTMLRRDPSYAALLPPGAPDPLPPDWLSPWARVEIEEVPAARRRVSPYPNRYIDLVLTGDDPDKLRACRAAVVPVLAPRLARVLGLLVIAEEPDTWELPADPVTPPRRRLALSLSCLALAALVGRAALGKRRRPAAAKLDPSPANHDSPDSLPAPARAPCGVQDFPPPQITAAAPPTP